MDAAHTHQNYISGACITDCRGTHIDLDKDTIYTNTHPDTTRHSQPESLRSTRQAHPLHCSEQSRGQTSHEAYQKVVNSSLVLCNKTISHILITNSKTSSIKEVAVLMSNGAREQRRSVLVPVHRSVAVEIDLPEELVEHGHCVRRLCLLQHVGLCLVQLLEKYLGGGRKEGREERE